MRRFPCIALIAAVVGCQHPTPIKTTAKNTPPAPSAAPAPSASAIAPPPPMPQSSRVYRDLGPPRPVFQPLESYWAGVESPDGLLFASSSFETRGVRIWDTERHAFVAELEGKHGTTQEIEWSRDGRWLLARGTRGSSVWNAATGRRVAIGGDKAQIIEEAAVLISSENDPHAVVAYALETGTEILRRKYKALLD